MVDGEKTDKDGRIIDTDTQAWDRFSYVRGNPVRYKDPTGHEAWKERRKWSAEDEGAFRKAFAENSKRIAQEAEKKGQTIDCADVALVALVRTSREMGLKLSFDVYDKNKRRYQTVSSGDDRFQNEDEFAYFVKKNMGALNLLDRKTTKPIEASQAKTGDLIMFDLRFHNRGSEYGGHTVIVTGVGASQGVVEAGAARLGNAMSGATADYREPRYERLFRR